MTGNIVSMFQTMHLASKVLRCSAKKQDCVQDSHFKYISAWEHTPWRSPAAAYIGEDVRVLGDMLWLVLRVVIFREWL